MAREKINENMILKAANYYYTHGLTQEEIAKKMGFSRPTVVRMLKQARDIGLVEIRITRELPQTILLETGIETALRNHNLREVIVVENMDGDPKAAVARRTADFLAHKLTARDILGIGWSSTLVNVPHYLSRETTRPRKVVQLGGYVGGLANASAQGIASRLGHVFDVPVEPLPAPVILKSREVRDSLLEDPSISTTLDWVDQCTIGLVGVGNVAEDSTLLKAGYISAAEREKIVRQGAVGDVQAHHYTLEGQELDTPWRDRMISVDMAQLMRIDNLVGVAAGADKAAAMIGAIRSNILNTIIIDERLAEQLLSLLEG